jgi:hypothetical protein
VDFADSQLALGNVLTVVHRCWHTERYPASALLTAEAQREFAAELAKDLCPRCVLAESRTLPAAA